MKRMIFLFGLVYLSLGAWGQKDYTRDEVVGVKNIPFRDLSHKFLKDGINIDEDSLDLVFDYKLYKKLITDSILDDLILEAGFEPNDENRTIFFSVISKDLQNQIKDSFYVNSENKNNKYYSQEDMRYRGIQYQAEMTRSMMTLVQSMASNINKSEKSSKSFMFFGAIATLLAAEFGFFGKAIKISNWFFNVKDKINKITVNVSDKTIGFWGNVWNKTVDNTFLKNIVYRDFSGDDPELKNIFKNFEKFICYLKDDPKRLEVLKKGKKIAICDKKMNAIPFIESGINNKMAWDIRDYNKK